MVAKAIAKPANPALAPLLPLLGEWSMQVRWSAKTHKLVGGPETAQGPPASFEWFEDGAFLIQRSGGGGAPKSRWMIGRDDASGAYDVLYSDDRGVSRVYQMSFEAGLWRIWRASPGFHQRFEGRFSPDGQTIEARWDGSPDGETWELDFHLTYRSCAS